MFIDKYLTLCELKGEKPYALVVKLGASSNSIVDSWKRGATPREPMLSRIAEYFGVSKAFLLGLKEEAPDSSVLDDPFVFVANNYSDQLTEEDKNVLIKMMRMMALANNGERNEKDGTNLRGSERTEHPSHLGKLRTQQL